MQPADVKIFVPAAGSPFSFDAGVTGTACACGSVPTTVAGVGATTPWAPHAAAKSTTANEEAIRIARRTGRDSTWPHYHVSHEAEVVWTRCRADDPDDLHEQPARAALRRLRARSLLRAEYRPRPATRDHHRDRGGPVLDVGQGRARGVRREDRHARRGA